MAKETSSSQNEENDCETAAERSAMPVELLQAAVEGNRDVIIRSLGLEEEQKHIQVTIEPSGHAAIQTEAANKIVESDLQSATHFGNTLLHILVANRHNELALLAFKKDASLLKARNKMLETPLHSAAKAGNEELIVKLIQADNNEVKGALSYTNRLGETALHVAVKHSHEGVVRELIRLDPPIACRVNKKGMSPLHAAIVRGNSSMVQTLLEGNPTLAYVPDSNGLYPVHVAARMGKTDLVMHFMREYPDSGELLDNQGRNIFHHAAQENKGDVFTELFGISETDTVINKMVTAMMNEMDYEGNTPLHVASMKGNMVIMIAISEKQQRNGDSVIVLNNEGLSPFDLYATRLKRTTADSEALKHKTEEYMRDKGPYFTPEWFKLILEQPTAAVQEKGNQDNVMDQTQVVGLGSVLIATVTFAAAFTLPGGYNQDNGTPVLGGKYIFKAFILADTLAFMRSFISVLLLLLGASGNDPSGNLIPYAFYNFCAGAGCMVVAFGLGLYLVLAPISKAIAILVLVFALLHGSPAVAIIIKGGQAIFATSLLQACRTPGFLFLMYVVPYMFIFFFAFL